MKLYIGNLSFNTTENDLQDAFERFGTVTDSMVMMDRTTGRSRGFGFITMGSPAEGTAAIEGMHGQALDGRTLTVNEARPRDERPRSGGGGGGYGGGGYGGGGGGGGDRGGDRRGGGGDRGGYSNYRR